MITGGEGNSPIRDPGWPDGAAAIFNTPSRIAYWEGPPFGGGQWHAECRGDAKALSAVLADFAKLGVQAKRVVVHDGVGRSFWLNPNDEPAKRAAAKMDWSFMVWQPANWERLRKLPADLNPTDPDDAGAGPPSQIDVYTGGNVKWADVVVPNLEGGVGAGAGGRQDFFIRKGSGWALRDHAGTDPTWVAAFVAEHGHAMAGLSKREAAKHLS